MTIPVLIILGVLWAAVLVPPLLRARSDRKTGAIGDYAHTLGVLKTSNKSIRSNPRSAAALVDATMHQNGTIKKQSGVKKRRRDVFNVLAGSVVILGIISAITPQALTIGLFLLALSALGVYSYMLFQINEIKKQKRSLRKRSENISKDGF